MTKAVAPSRRPAPVARPLKVLVPAIQAELSQGDAAGVEHYRRAGQMLQEAHSQVPQGRWVAWLRGNFALSPATAFRYINLSKRLTDPVVAESATTVEPPHVAERGRIRAARRRADARALREVTPPAAVERFREERTSRMEEIDLHRQLAVQLVTAGYRALATRLHPDRGGSKEAMVRLNRVRDELKAVAESRTYV